VEVLVSAAAARVPTRLTSFWEITPPVAIKVNAQAARIAAAAIRNDFMFSGLPVLESGPLD
jgi:hypothetical protein